jgi:hypothetical protein
MSADNSVVRASIPVLPILGIVFIVLKLMHVIAWSWLWVLAPFWAPIVLAILFLLLAFALVLFGVVS